MHSSDIQADADRTAEATPIAEIDVSRIDRFKSNTHWPFFARLRREDPVHLCAESPFGPYWSATLYDDIVLIDRNYRQFSSEGNVIIGDVPASFNSRAFIVSDPPVHTRERRAVMPALSPKRLAALEATFRARIGAVLDGLPRGETFNWAERVSAELTIQTVATLFDFPWEERHLLPYWSDVTLLAPRPGVDTLTTTERQAAIEDYTARLREMWRARTSEAAGDDLISALARSPGTAGMIDDPVHLVGTVTLLVGANDTTRSSMSAGVVAFNMFPAEWQRLRADPSLVSNAASEIVRWQTPLSHMRRTATEDVEFRGKPIRKGDRVVMWYCSGNRDEKYFEEADAFRIDRPNARRHLAYGFGIHRCVGRHVAEMQLRILWQGILERFDRIDLMAEPKRSSSNFLASYDELLVRIPA